MGLNEEFEPRKQGYAAKLEAINCAIEEEMGKAHKRRRRSLLAFLSHEKKLYSFALTELEAMTGGSVEAGAGSKFCGPEEERATDWIDAEATSERAAGSRRVYHIGTWGGFGDVLLLTPTIRALKRRDPACKIYIYCVEAEHKHALRNNPYIDHLISGGVLTVPVLRILGRLRLLNVQRANYGSLLPSLFYKKRAAGIIGEMFGVEIDNGGPDCFLTEKEESEARKIVSKYRNPVVIQTTAGCSPNKNWPKENWDELVANNPAYDFIQLGGPKDELAQGANDLRGKSSLRQSFGIIKAAKAFVGVDSVLGHAAAAFHTPAVVLFGASTPIVWGHEINRNLYNAPRCSPCIDVLVRDPCPYGTPCMSNITPAEVGRALSLSIAGAPSGDDLNGR